jgi:hypothetical protein
MDKGVEAHTLYNTPPVRQSKTASLYQCNNLSLSHYTAKAKMRQTKREAQLQGIEPRIFTYESNSVQRNEGDRTPMPEGTFSDALAIEPQPLLLLCVNFARHM